jgi:5-methylcytosine-specific restriction protein A
MGICYNTGRTRFKKRNKVNLGRVQSEETKKKIGLANKGNIAHWKGGITKKSHLDRVKFKREVQKLVFERDNYKCQRCGKGGDLQVDHIQSWAKYVELRFDMNNCRTLCKECHYEITYGKTMPNYIRTWGHNLSKKMKGGEF